jgi:NADPH-dependent 2,4-dienoyl-CoA reductase/sulfur reductase-like enzyme
MVRARQCHILAAIRLGRLQMIPNSAGETTTTGEHATVLGASMAGLLAARVLADFYARVTVVERVNWAGLNRSGNPTRCNISDFSRSRTAKPTLAPSSDGSM